MDENKNMENSSNGSNPEQKERDFVEGVEVTITGVVVDRSFKNELEVSKITFETNKGNISSVRWNNRKRC